MHHIAAAAVPQVTSTAVQILTIYQYKSTHTEFCCVEQEQGTDDEDAGRMHAYMIISLGGGEERTVVIKAQDLEEFDEDEPMDFHTDGATVRRQPATI